MPNPIDENPTASICILVAFSYETPETVVRYAAWETDVSLDGDVFTSRPSIEVKLPKQDGTARGTDTEIKMEEIAPISSMRTTFPPVTVDIWEMDPSDETTAVKHYRGTIARNEYNYNGNPDAVRVIVSGVKRLLDTTVSIKISRFCAWIFGKAAGGPCQYDREANKETNTILSVAGNKVTLTTALANSDPDFWKFGGLRFNGFEINIHRVSSPTEVFTVRPLPTHWVGQVVDVLPGCDKTVPTCRLRDQEDVMVPLGLKLPNRDIRTTPQ